MTSKTPPGAAGDLDRFRQGNNESVPSNETLAVADQLADALLEQELEHAETGVNPDGRFYFDARNRSGQLILGELSPDGRLGATRYDENGHPTEELPPRPHREGEVNGNLERILDWLRR